MRNKGKVCVCSGGVMTGDSCAAASAPAGHRGDGLENIACNNGLLTCDWWANPLLSYFKYCLHGKCEVYTVFQVFFFYFSIKNEFAMCNICVHSNYQLHTCGSRTRVTEIISRELPTLECIFIPRCSCNRLRQHTIVHGCWFPGAIIICASVCGNSDENDWKTPWQQPGNGSQSICAFLNKCSSPPQTVFNGSFFFLSYPRLPFRLHLSIPSLPFDSRSPGTPTFLFVPY